MDFKKGYDLDDLLIIPRDSSVNSRTDVDISTKISNNFTLDVPLIASPMRGIVGVRLIKELGRLGGLGILHRFYKSADERLADILDIDSEDINYGIAMGTQDSEFEFVANLLPQVKNLKVICIDVANGYTDNYADKVFSLEMLLQNFCKYESEIYGHIKIMAGNVATREGYIKLLTYGATLIRVGIGSGTMCVTRNKTGIGVPQASAITDCKNRFGFMVADGGIKYTGQGVKALALGADFLMIGAKLAETNESDNNGLVYGMASRELQEMMYKDVKSVEGIKLHIDKTVSMEEYVRDFAWSIKSACTYVNATNLKELRENSTFTLTGNSSIDNSRMSHI